MGHLIREKDEESRGFAMAVAGEFTVVLSREMADLVERKVRSGTHASVSDVVQEGLQALQDREAELERWLHEDVVEGHAEYLADPGKAVPAEELLGQVKLRRAASRR